MNLKYEGNQITYFFKLNQQHFFTVCVRIAILSVRCTVNHDVSVHWLAKRTQNTSSAPAIFLNM